MKMTVMIVLAMATAMVVSAADPQDAAVFDKDQQTGAVDKIIVLKKNLANAAVPDKDQQEQIANKIRGLQKVRISTLKEVTEAANTAFRQAKLSIDEVYESKLVLHQAEVDYAATEIERIQLQTVLIGVMEEYERVISKREAGQATNVIYFKVIARRLEAEIALEQFKARVEK
jgi:hypothetical protein